LSIEEGKNVYSDVFSRFFATFPEIVPYWCVKMTQFFIFYGIFSKNVENTSTIPQNIEFWPFWPLLQFYLRKSLAPLIQM